MHVGEQGRLCWACWASSPCSLTTATSIYTHTLTHLPTHPPNKAERGIDLDGVMKGVLGLARTHEVSIDSNYAALVIGVCVIGERASEGGQLRLRMGVASMRVCRLVCSFILPTPAPPAASHPLPPTLPSWVCHEPGSARQHHECRHPLLPLPRSDGPRQWPPVHVRSGLTGALVCSLLKGGGAAIEKAEFCHCAICTWSVVVRSVQLTLSVWCLYLMLYLICCIQRQCKTDAAGGGQAQRGLNLAAAGAQTHEGRTVCGHACQPAACGKAVDLCHSTLYPLLKGSRLLRAGQGSCRSYSSQPPTWRHRQLGAKLIAPSCCVHYIASPIVTFRKSGLRAGDTCSPTQHRALSSRL